MDGDIKIVCIEAPLYGDGRRWRMEDLAVQLGAVYFQKALHMDLRSVNRKDFGTAAHARVTKQQTVISGPGGDKAAVEARVRELNLTASAIRSALRSSHPALRPFTRADGRRRSFGSESCGWRMPSMPRRRRSSRALCRAVERRWFGSFLR